MHRFYNETGVRVERVTDPSGKAQSRMTLTLAPAALAGASLSSTLAVTLDRGTVLLLISSLAESLSSAPPTRA